MVVWYRHMAIECSKSRRPIEKSIFYLPHSNPVSNPDRIGGKLNGIGLDFELVYGELSRVYDRNVINVAEGAIFFSLEPAGPRLLLNPNRTNCTYTHSMNSTFDIEWSFSSFFIRWGGVACFEREGGTTMWREKEQKVHPVLLYILNTIHFLSGVE